MSTAGSSPSAVDDGEVLVATTSALWIGAKDGWEKIDLSGEALHTAVRHRRELWAAGLRGILRRRGGGWERDTELNGRLPDSWITALLPDGGSIWAGTYDAGVLRLDGNGSWRTVVRHAWVNPNAMIATPGGVAIGTMGNGLLLFDRSTGTWLRLTTSSGLPSDDVTALHMGDESLWVGTRAGIAEVPMAGTLSQGSAIAPSVSEPAGHRPGDPSMRTPRSPHPA